MPTTNTGASSAYASAARQQTQLLETIAAEISLDDDSLLPGDCKNADWADVGTLQASNDKLIEALAMLGNEHAMNRVESGL